MMSIELALSIWSLLEPTLSHFAVCSFAVWFVSTLQAAMVQAKRLALWLYERRKLG